MSEPAADARKTDNTLHVSFTVEISFTVQGKPPRKSGWGSKTDAPGIARLRHEALRARNHAGLDCCVAGPVRLELAVYAPNVTDPDYRQSGDDDPEKVVGDLDGLISGVCDYLQAAPTDQPDMKIDSVLTDSDINHAVPIIIKDDMQIVEIDARKIRSESLYYTVRISSVQPR